MSYVGKMDDLKWSPPFHELVIGRDIMLDDEGRLTKMPVLSDGTFLFGAIKQGLGENVFLCESIEDFQTLLQSNPLWFSAPQPASAHEPSWQSKTGKFSEIEIHLIEVYNVVALKRMMLRHLPIEAMRALAELMLHDDPRLNELLLDEEVTDHWKGWASDGCETSDVNLAAELSRRRTQLTDRQMQKQ